MRFSVKLSGACMALLFLASIMNAQIPAKWNLDEINPGEDISLEPDATQFTEGNKSCHLRLLSGSVPYLLSDPYPVVGGAAYEFSIDVFDSDTAGQIKIYADFYDAYGFDVFGAPPVFSKDSNEWYTIHWTDTIPPQAVIGYILVKYYCQPGLYTFTKQSDAWIDNILFRTEGGNNLVANGGFEQWTVGIGEDSKQSDQVALYPNPASDLIYVKLPVDGQCMFISDMLGKQVIKIELNGESSVNVDVSNLKDGLYLLTIQAGRGHTVNEKLFVSHK